MKFFILRLENDCECLSVSKNRGGWVDEGSVISEFNFGKSSPEAISFCLPKSLEGFHSIFLRV